MKIALLTDGIYPYVLGGMQRHSFYLCKYLLQQGVSVDLYHTQWEKDTDIESLNEFTQDEKKRLRSFVVPWPKEDKFPGHYMRASYKYSQNIYEEFLKHSTDVDFVYAKGFTAWKLLKEKKKGLKVPPLGIKFHGYEMYQSAPNFKTRLQHWLLKGPTKWNTRHADYVFSYGGKITKLISSLGIMEDKILEIPSGIEADWLAPQPTRVNMPRRFVFMGRYERRKGIEELIHVLNVLDKQDTFEFHFIGPVPNHLKMKRSNIHYHGKIKETERIQEILRNSDVLVCPSYAEGMPNVILEAMASGLAIIASDVGAISALVSLENGILVQAANQNELSWAIQNVLSLSDAELLKKKNTSIKKIEQHFLWSKIIKQTLNKIEKISSNSM